MQRIQRMQEFFLGGRLFGEKMQIIQEQGVAFAEDFAERRKLALVHGADETVGKFLGRQMEKAAVGMVLLPVA